MDPPDVTKEATEANPSPVKNAQVLNPAAPIARDVPPAWFTAALDARIETLATSMDAKIETLATSLDAKIETLATSLDAKIETLATSLDAKIETLTTAWDAKIETLSTALDAKIETLSTALYAKIEILATSLDEKIAPLSTQINSIIIQQQIQRAMLLNGLADYESDPILPVPNAAGISPPIIFPKTHNDVRELNVNNLNEFLSFYGEDPRRGSVANKRRRLTRRVTKPFSLLLGFRTS